MSASKIRIVIVDDNTDFMFVLRKYMSEKDGIEVVGTAANGLDAVKIIKAVEPDIVIMDIVMPKLDGLGVLEKINMAQMDKKPQFIIVTAIALSKIMQIAISLGAEYFMLKPFDLEDLVSRIRQLQSFGVQNEVRIHGSNEKNIELQILEIIRAIGVPEKLKGHQYLVEAVKMVATDLTAINSITKKVYPGIANKFNTTSERVERAIRNAIELTWTRGNFEKIAELFGNELNKDKTRPSNSEFITTVANKLWGKSGTL